MFPNKFRKKRTENQNNENVPNARREETSELRLRQAQENDAIDTKYGFVRITEYQERTGFLLNIHTNEILNDDKRLISAVDYYFMEEDGTRFKVSYPFKPYFYILTQRELLHEVSMYLLKKYAGTIDSIEEVVKEDLDLPNHLIGLKQRYLKLSFVSQNDCIKVRKDILTVVRKNRKRKEQNCHYAALVVENIAKNTTESSHTSLNTDHLENILDIREYDVPYHVRVSIDLRIFCGSWYTVKCKAGGNHPPLFTPRPDIIERPEPIVLAFDIETTKLPLKFPDANTDQIMMISYMIDGQGFLITNREILSADIEDFEYTPKPELEGKFTIFNEPNEFSLIQRFFYHIMDVRPHIFVTYNGDFFDWPFVEARAAFYELDMKQEIGFSKSKDGIYSCRAATHMDCLCWVKRDSYLPVGSQGLKAVAKAKLRYDPVELDPEEMCPLAASQPQVLSNYSVSDAVATYYLYMQYVHPFIFALCTIIPCEPDEVLRKGSGTLCEALLMVEAFQVNVIFPNKQETILNKLTDDGHLLHQETYVGGHVEALESGIFRADIPCRFRLDIEMLDTLISQISKTLTHAIEVEEGIPLDCVTNLQNVTDEIKTKLEALKEQPMRLEKPLIYHLDVGAMYPNVILTNRLQPYAMVDETVCAACDFNKPGATCQRGMAWMWRAEYMPASRSEYHRIQQQLETEKFPPLFPNGPQRAFHELKLEEQAELEKKRMGIYCRKVYKKQKVTKMEERTSTVCQKENSFYVDTVRAFRDRRYEYKSLSKKAKQQVVVAVIGGNAAEIKSAKNREILYDSLQLAHKCILNSFYGYVMRRGARWHSMEMGGIVCYTGANIIMKTREIVERVGRPLELDTDGIWCILPASFPDNVTVTTSDEKKKKLNISYPNAVLNAMVKANFTNDQYHELTDPYSLSYVQKSENSIFFEVDGPYRAMVLPASKEEGKKLKKRYAVFNFDGSLAELKGFEVKRRGELQLIKIFQSSVFEAFLKGDSLESCYAAVAQIADYWLDVLYSQGRHMPDSELFDLISENRSMSRKLEDYGAQKSTSISTAKRLAEFLGDQMVKDAGLACKYVISKKPEGAPVTERAIPLAIFQAEEAVQKYYLRKWLKDSSLNDFDIRDLLDWSYYIERLGGAIQKIITIPAAMQGVSNPVPRVRHPDWLHKKMLEKDDNFKQRRITDMFSACAKNAANTLPTSKVKDIEDCGVTKKSPLKKPIANVNKRKRQQENEFEGFDLTLSWREALGTPPLLGETKADFDAWLAFQKKKWKYQMLQRLEGQQKVKRLKGSTAVVRSAAPGTLQGFLLKAQRALLANPWQILQIVKTNTPGEFLVWVLVESEIHIVKLIVPRMFYANLRTPKCADEGALFKKCNRTLPRSKQVNCLYLYTVQESLFEEYGKELQLNNSNVEGVYETQVPLIFRAFVQLGCVCRVTSKSPNMDSDTFSLSDLEMTSISKQPYLPKDSLKHLFLYQHRSNSDKRQFFGLFLTPIKKAIIIVVETVRHNEMPNLKTIYQAERIAEQERNPDIELPPEDLQIMVRIETDVKEVHKLLQKHLQAYRDEKKGPTLLAIQTLDDTLQLQHGVPVLTEFPQAHIHVKDVDDLYNSIDWRRIGAKALIRHYLNSERVLEFITEQCRYYHLPIGNLPTDPTLFASDLFFARHLIKQNHVLWCSNSDRPDLGGSEESDARLLAESQEESSELCNKPGWYSSICIELDIDSLAINTLLQAHHITDIEGTSSATAFDAAVPPSLDELISGNMNCGYDETARCGEAFRILRTMATIWMRDISLYRNRFADFQVIHFYRWLRSQKSLLYDPALLRNLQNLMKKLFMMLVAEFKRLGCTIIYANFNKIILCSKKRLVEDALANAEFVITSIRNKELFHSLQITYSKCWEQLIWLDSTNFAGIQGKLPAGLEGEAGEVQERIETTNRDVVNEDEPVIVMNWNLAEQLPEAGGCRHNFNAIIAGYINAIYMKLRETDCNDSIVVGLSQPSLGLGANEVVTSYAKELIEGEVSQNLFRIVERIFNRLPAKIDDCSPALEFVNAICHVLDLDPAVHDEVYNLKCNLLKLIGVGEFSEKAVWIDRTVSFVVPQIICKACNHCRDLDLGRDPHRSDVAWLCPLCNTDYDNNEIEGLILEIINKKFLAYNLQDMQCKKCGQIKMENLMMRCQCASEFMGLLPKADFVKLLEKFYKLAKTFNMKIVKEFIENVLALI
ncbi:hypothetical protein PPYR_00580 [Photinus pyralis]|uniref:DNA polymerase epsilon catalytic subunit n=3 Tax=Photinus pyralis TaxID=7054 RepID=A0A5N4B2J2_PHOPY|nr:DNA polymerase epsilon catalytic subunit A [Photinus pyralis]KAB0803610.1 hypothetical protein PPYR_00580 [Photinus pyralis]